MINTCAKKITQNDRNQYTNIFLVKYINHQDSFLILELVKLSAEKEFLGLHFSSH